MNKDTLFCILSSLNTLELAKVREVCKDYYNISNKIFLEIVEKSKKEDYYDLCEKGNYIIMYLYNKRINIDKGMCKAAKGGHRDLIEFFISKGADDFDYGMFGAAEGGNKNLVEFFISKGVDNWNWGMYGAAKGGHKNLVEFFIAKGANEWNLGASGATQGDHKELVEFFKSKG